MTDYLRDVKNYFVGKYTVQNNFWNNVCEKAEEIGYDILKRNGNGELPATRITFYDAVKFCNALNEICGLKPVYYEDGKVIKTGFADNVEISGKGIRLPAEKEWEYAATGDRDTLYFWGNEKGNNRTNQYAWMYDWDDKENAFLLRKPGLKKANQFGLYDVSGNVYEWCFDKFSDTDFRILKGGSVTLDSILESKFTSYSLANIASIDIGFRIFSDVDIELPDWLFRENETDEEYRNNKFDLFELLDLEVPELKQIKDYYLKGDIKSAKKEYIYLLKKRAEDKEFDYSFYMPVKMPALEKLMAKNERITWFAGDKNYSSYHGLVIFAIPLAEMYRVTKDKKYLKQFITVTNFIDYAKDEFDNLKPEELNRVSISVPDSWCYTQGFDSCKRLEHVTTIVLSMFLKYMDYSDMDDELVDALLKHMVRTITEDLPLVIKDARSVIPNQSLENAKSLIYAGNIFVGYKYAENLKKLGYDRILEATIGKCVFPDGTDMEQSYNYNFAICKIVEEFISYFGKLPEQLLPLKEAAVNRIRFLKTVSYPHGGYPATGTMSGTFPPVECKTVEEIGKFAKEYDDRNFKRFENIEKEEIGVISAVFPYSATTVMKNNNSVEAVYMWHFAARPGSGHAVENINSIQLSAYGMPMLVNAGASTYENIGFVPENQWDMIPEYEKYQHSSWGSNTVLIDGKSQGRLKYGENNKIDKYSECCDNAFYTDEYFDYSQGVYSGLYFDENGEFNAEHMREIIYVKKHNVFIIKDTIKADGEHEFSARFGIMPEGGENRQNTVIEELYLTMGYCKDEVIIDSNHIYTNKKGYPNFEIYVPEPGRNVTSEYGVKKPCRGWFRGAIRSGAKEKYDISVSWQGRDVTENITVIAVSENEKLPIGNLKYDDKVLNISLNDGNITFDGECVITSDGQKFNKKSAKVPKAFKWAKKNGKMIIDYGI